MTATEAPTLLDREPELERFDALIGELTSGEGGAISVTGPPGIGKTSLLEALATAARTSGVRVLQARGSELERSFAFGAMHQLLDELLRDHAERETLLAGAAALAEPVFAHHRSGVTTSDEDGSYPVLHGLYWLIGNLARQEPLLLIIDDLQWVDEPTRRFLAFLENRLEGMAVMVATAERDEEARGAAPPVGGEATLMSLRPLGERAVEEMIARTVGPDSVELAAACKRASGGNPFLLVELLDELARADADGRSAADVGRLAPGSVRAFAIGRLAAIEDGERVARAVAVLGDGVGIDRVATLAELGVDATGEIADELTAASVLAIGRPLAFAHPIIRVAIHEALPRGLRSRLHRRAAALSAEAGDPGRAIATHLLETDPAGDETVVARLVEVATDSVARGAPEPAIELLRRASAEPPPDRFRSLVSLELGTQLGMLGEPEAIDHLHAALAAAQGDLERAQIGVVLVDALLHSGRMSEGLAALESALEIMPPGETQIAAGLEGRLLPLACSAASGRRLAGARLDEIAIEVEANPEPAPGTVRAGVAFNCVVGDRPDAARALDLAERALADPALPDEPVFVAGAINALFLAGAFEVAEREFERLIGSSQERGRARDFAVFSGLRAWSRWQHGRLSGAEADARAALDLAAESPWEMLTSLPAAIAASIELERGDLDAAARATAPFEYLRDNADIGFTQLLHVAVARRLAAAGEHVLALQRLEPCREFEAAWGSTSGVRLVTPWRAAAVPSLIATGDPGAAREIAAEQLATAEAFGAPRVVGEALLISAAVEEATESIASIERAIALLTKADATLELARAEIELGRRLRRSGTRARSREMLTTGMDRAHRIGATALSNRARDELVLAGARPRRLATSGPDSLTASERRVATMAVEGMMNREIAQALFVTLRTVEGHLSNAFRKLEINSREELGLALGGGTSRLD